MAIVALMADIPATMRAVAVTRPGGPDVLELVELPTPSPGPGQVLIAVAAAGLNGADRFQRRGRYDPPPDASPLLGLEVAGTIVGLGDGVDPARRGTDVVALADGGGYADYAAMPAAQVLPLPPGWTMVEGATLPETFFTIQQTVIEHAALKAGQTLLIHGGAGGIGATAIQMARLHGAVPFATVSSREKADYALAMGAEATIDHRQEDFVARIREFTQGRGADVVVDMVGGPNAAANLNAAAPGGTIVQLTALAGSGEVDPGLLVAKGLTWFGSILRAQPAEAKARWAASLLADVWPAIADGRIKKPRIRAFAFEDVAAAHHAFDRRDHYGKIVLDLTS
jgi:NADPH2:quinone reductase